MREEICIVTAWSFLQYFCLQRFHRQRSWRVKLESQEVLRHHLCAVSSYSRVRYAQQRIINALITGRPSGHDQKEGYWGASTDCQGLEKVGHLPGMRRLHSPFNHTISRPAIFPGDVFVSRQWTGSVFLRCDLTRILCYEILSKTQVQL